MSVTANNTVRMPASELNFDRANPRLVEYGVTSASTDADILQILWDTMDVRELVQSIAASGFFEHEPLIVAEEEGRKIVIEGNRRLAAVKVLLDRSTRERDGWPIPELQAREREDLENRLPVAMSDRRDSWRYLGFKHVNGPAKWTSYAKAKYIADVHRQYGIALCDIADQIGDRHNTVRRLYRGLMVLEQAERTKVYDRDDRYRPHLSFSHLYTGLDYDNISSFIDLRSEEEEAEDPVPVGRLSQLGELCRWLYGSKREKSLPVVESQNPHLRQLNAVLGSMEAVSALRDDRDLQRAYELSRPSSSVFEESILAAKRELLRARAHLTTGYDGSEQLLRVAGSVAQMAEDIYDEMHRKFSGGKKQRMTEL